MNDNRWTSAALCVAVLLLTASPLLAQSSRMSAAELAAQEELRAAARAGMTTNQMKPVALESVIDPEHYYVGPSDQFSIAVWSTPPLSATIMVTPEGSLVIPTIGEVRVADLTLAAAKEKVKSAIRRNYARGEIVVTLVQPRPVVVMVVGSVLFPGLYTLSAVDRATKAIESANRGELMELSAEQQYMITLQSTRNVALRHRDGTSSRVDLDKFLGTHDQKYNPFLREGDVIIVPRKVENRNTIGVYGEVNNPSRYEYVDGDSLLDMVRLAQGFTTIAHRDSAAFSRLDLTGTVQTQMVISLNAIMEGRAPNIPLQPGDRLVVFGKSEQRADYRVEVKGEVRYPGTYPISRDRTRLSEIIERAGGFTEQASLKTAEVVRRSVEPNKIRLEQLESLRGGADVEDSTYYLLETSLRINKEIVNADFHKLFVEKDSTHNIFLQTDDVINVPPRNKNIYVFGQVVSPGNVPFTDGKSVDWYIAMAGGFTQNAR
ncbi:MAG: Periplasmic polysaccharide export protein, partial [Bacteroidetes bacterium]|nr:Periplasmic polysaccharide export protein [Bacteroidota bacterium]